MIWIRIFIFLILFLITGCTGNKVLKEHNKFVTTEWLHEHLNDSTLSPIFIGRKVTFDSIHIPNSQYISIRDLLIRTDSLRNELPEINKIDSVLTSVGINDNSIIVLYYENDLMIPATSRLFLTLNYAGLGDKTYMLNGGLLKWVKEGRKTTDSIFAKRSGELNLIENNRILVTAFDVENYMNNPDYVLMDARPVDQYTGQFDSVENTFNGGHIEGAVSLPFENLLSDTLPFMFKYDVELRKEFERAGMNSGKIAVIYCNTGIWGSVNYLVSAHLGYQTLFYDGSFEDWENLKLPVIKPVDHKPDNN